MKEVEKFLNTLRSEKTKQDYERYINDFCNFKNIKNIEDFKKMTIDDYYDWNNYLKKEKNNSENTIRPKLISINSFYDYLITNPIYNITDNPIKDSKIIGKNKAIINPERRSWLTYNERKEFMHCCKNKREIAIVSIFLNTALRVSELINLPYSEYTRFYNKNGELSSYAVLTRKGGKKQKIYFNPTVTKKIDDYLKIRKETEYDNLFVSNTGKPMSTQSIDRTIRKIAKKAGIQKRVSAHSLRRTAATDMYNNGYDLRTIQNVLGHSNPATTERYIREVTDNLEDVMMDYVVGKEI